MTKITFIDGDIKSMMRHSLLVCHNIFPSPIYVLRHWFAVIGNGMEWDEKDGKLKYGYQYDAELWTPRERETYPEDSLMKEYYEKCKLQDEWDDIEWKFILNNIDRIVESDYVNDFKDNRVGRSAGGHYVTEDISTKYASAFTFPDNIDKDWAKLLYSFIGWWYVRLNMKYGVGNQKRKEDYRGHWPEDIFAAATELDKSRDRLCVIIYGKTQQQKDDEERAWMQAYLAESAGT